MIARVSGLGADSAAGTVNAGAASAMNVLFINQSAGDPITRTVTVTSEDSIEIELQTSASGPLSDAVYVLYIWNTCRKNPFALDVGTSVLGTMVNPTPIQLFATPQAIFCIRSPQAFLDVLTTNIPEIPAPATGAPWTKEIGSGAGMEGTFLLQAILEDGGSWSPDGYSVSNAITLRIEAP